VLLTFRSGAGLTKNRCRKLKCSAQAGPIQEPAMFGGRSSTDCANAPRPPRRRQSAITRDLPGPGIRCK
jgi:hypothetical protein